MADTKQRMVARIHWGANIYHSFNTLLIQENKDEETQGDRKRFVQ